MKNTTKRVRRMAYCREDDGSALDQPSDKALAREEMLVRNKTRRKVVCASRSPFQRQFDHLNSVGVTQQPAQPGIPRFRARQNYDFQPGGVDREAIQYHLRFPKTRRRTEVID
ncbi:MAG: hypothetical protein DME55_15240 [Verrucomicrobia bacterium]|nr:MAG: hypothetical protein DME55_15240 [Verrucomicrobiota bacterium]